MTTVARYLVLLAALSVVATCVTPAAAQTSWSTKSGFSLATNPIGSFTLGFIGEDGVFHPYNTRFSPCQGVDGWCLDDDPDAAGNVTLNTSSTAVEDFGVRWEPGQVLIHPGSGRCKVVIRWTAPISRSLSLDALFSGRSRGGLPANVRLYLNGKEAAASEVAGFSGQGDTHEGRVGTNPEVRYLKSIQVNKGDTLDLVIDSVGLVAVGHVGLSLTIGPGVLGENVDSPDSPNTVATDLASGQLGWWPGQPGVTEQASLASWFIDTLRLDGGRG